MTLTRTGGGCRLGLGTKSHSGYFLVVERGTWMFCFQEVWLFAVKVAVGSGGGGCWLALEGVLGDLRHFNIKVV